jgi:hypothetical protein
MNSGLDYFFYFITIVLVFLIFIQNEGSTKKNIGILNSSKLSTTQILTFLGIICFVFVCLLKSQNN